MTLEEQLRARLAEITARRTATQNDLTRYNELLITLNRALAGLTSNRLDRETANELLTLR